MKELIVLYFLFSFGIGKENEAINELSDLKANSERTIDLANQMNEVYKVGLDRFFMKLSNKSLCIDEDVLKNDYSKYTKELENITLPMKDWISQTSNKIKELNVFLNQLQFYEELTDFDLPGFIRESFIGDCSLSFPKDRLQPETNINTNDIYDYQNKVNCDREGSEEFQCRSGECIALNRTCDGAVDCWDGSDELGDCRGRVGCGGCRGFCVHGPAGPRCLSRCPRGFQYSIKLCSNLSNKPCYSLCLRESQPKTISAKCLLQIFSNLRETTDEKYGDLLSTIYSHYLPTIMKCQDKHTTAITDKTNPSEGGFTNPPGWHTTTRHPTWHTTTRHPTWHTTTRHPTWHPTTRHPTWHPTTWHPTWHPTTRHPTWHPTTRHPTWHPTTSHPTWHPTTWHPTWHPTTRHPTWHPTTRHPTWHPTTSHPTWHPTTWHPTWHPTTRHPTWHPTTRHTTTQPTTWVPAVSDSGSDESDYSTLFDEIKHHTTKHTTPHSTTAHTRHTTKHHTTKHTTKHTTHHTTTATTPTSSTTPHTTTTPKPPPPSTTTTTKDWIGVIVL